MRGLRSINKEVKQPETIEQFKSESDFLKNCNKCKTSGKMAGNGELSNIIVVFQESQLITPTVIASDAYKFISHDAFERRFKIRTMHNMTSKQDHVRTFKATFGNFKIDKRIMLDVIINNRHIELPCEHYMIGGSYLDKLINKKVCFRMIHQKFTSYPRVNEGKYAEAAFAREEAFDQFQYSYRSSRLPFICATGDFITSDKLGKTIVEIKSSIGFKKATGHVTNKRNFMQILCMMEICKIDSAKMVIYQTEMNDTVVVSKVHEVIITKKCDFFQKKVANLLILGYLDFIQSYFDAIGNKFLPSDGVIWEKKLNELHERPENPIPIGWKKLRRWCKYFSYKVVFQDNYATNDDYGDDETEIIKEKVVIANKEIIRKEFSYCYYQHTNRDLNWSSFCEGKEKTHAKEWSGECPWETPRPMIVKTHQEFAVSRITFDELNLHRLLTNHMRLSFD